MAAWIEGRPARYGGPGLVRGWGRWRDVPQPDATAAGGWRQARRTVGERAANPRLGWWPDLAGSARAGHSWLPLGVAARSRRKCVAASSNRPSRPAAVADLIEVGA
jgi:hypothetical protein